MRRRLGGDLRCRHGRRLRGRHGLRRVRRLRPSARAHDDRRRRNRREAHVEQHVTISGKFLHFGDVAILHRARDVFVLSALVANRVRASTLQRRAVDLDGGIRRRHANLDADEIGRRRRARDGRARRGYRRRRHGRILRRTEEDQEQRERHEDRGADDELRHERAEARFLERRAERRRLGFGDDVRELRFFERGITLFVNPLIDPD